MAFNGTPVWIKKTLSYTDFATAATTNTVELFSLPAQGVIHQVILKHSTSFTGGGLTTYTISVGVSGTLTKYLAAANVFQATGDTVLFPASATSPVSQTAISFNATPISIVAAATGSGNLSLATAGSVDVWILTSVLQ